MILILTEEFDYPTIKVIEKLKQKNANYKIVYGTDLIDKRLNINVNEEKVYLDNEELKGKPTSRVITPQQDLPQAVSRTKMATRFVSHLRYSCTISIL